MVSHHKTLNSGIIQKTLPHEVHKYGIPCLVTEFHQKGQKAGIFPFYSNMLSLLLVLLINLYCAYMYMQYTTVKSPTSVSCRPPDKSAYWKIIFLITQPKHMLWVLKRTVSMRRFF